MRRKVNDAVDTGPEYRSTFIEEMMQMITAASETEGVDKSVTNTAQESLQDFVAMSDNDQIFAAEESEEVYNTLSTIDLSEGLGNDAPTVTLVLSIARFDKLLEFIGVIATQHGDDLPWMAEIYAEIQMKMIANIANILSPEAQKQVVKLMGAVYEAQRQMKNAGK